MAKKTGKTTRKKTSTPRKSAAKAVEPKPEPKPALSAGILSQIVHQMVIDACSDDQIRDRNKGDDRIDEYIEEARKRLARASHFDRDSEIGMGIARMRAVYSVALATDHPSAAVSAQAQISKLLALYPKEPKGDGVSTPEQVDELAQIEQHLRPLGLAPDDYPVVELARIAAERIRMLEAGHGGR